MEEPHKTHQEPAWGWIGALSQGRKPRTPKLAAKPVATHRHLMGANCTIPVAESGQPAS